MTSIAPAKRRNTRRIDEIDSGKVAGVDAFDAIQSM